MKVFHPEETKKAGCIKTALPFRFNEGGDSEWLINYP